jgi:cobalt/nickel transport system permease protein
MTLAIDAADHFDSPLARLDARWKLAAFIVAIAAAAVVRTVVGVLLAGFGACVLVEVARLPGKFWGGRIGGFALFLLPFLLLLAFIQGQYWAAAIIGIRALTLFVLAAVLVGSSPMHRNIQAAQSLGMPVALTQIALMSYRYLFVIREEFQRIRTALRVRAFRSGANWRTYRIVGHVAAMLLVRGDERAQRVYHAMRCRGFDGRMRSLSPFRPRYADVYFFAAVAISSIAIVACDLIVRR